MNSKKNREKTQRLRVKISWIGFNKRDWKSVKFIKREHKNLLNNAFIRFQYGIKDFSYMVGKVYEISKRGVAVKTDYGYRLVLWKRISRIYLAKRRLIK